MGLVYLRYTWMVDLYGKFVGKYTSPMDPMGLELGSYWMILPCNSPDHPITKKSLDLVSIVDDPI